MAKPSSASASKTPAVASIIARNETNDAYVYGYRISAVPVQFTDGRISGNVAQDLVRTHRHLHVLVKVGFSKDLKGLDDRFGSCRRAWNKAGVTVQLPKLADLRQATTNGTMLTDTQDLRAQFHDLLFIVPAPLSESAEEPLRWAMGRPVDKTFIRSLNVELHNEFEKYGKDNMAPTEYVVTTRIHASRLRSLRNHTLLRASTYLQLPGVAGSRSLHDLHSHFFVDLPPVEFTEEWPEDFSVHEHFHRCKTRTVSQAFTQDTYTCCLCSQQSQGIYFKCDAQPQCEFAAHPECAFERRK